MMKLNKCFASAFAAFSILLSINSFAQTAEDITGKCEVICSGVVKERICDNNVATHSSGQNITISIKSDESIGGIYLKYNNHAPVSGTLNDTVKIATNGFVHEFIDIDNSNEAKLSFDSADICDIFVFSEGEIPSDVQRWETGDEETDILLCATHSDDDQLFFAGLLPYYAGHKDVNVRVAYFINHYDTYNRTHELLDGLWHCGVKNYPDISSFSDGYSESYKGALSFLENKGHSYQDIFDFQKSLLEKYKPLVVVLHDFEGEYGHGAHILNAKSFIDVCENGETYVPEKIYVHLYSDNQIKLPIDESLDSFDGKTAFQVSQEAFGFHKSQHWTWFYGWIYGKGTKITSSTQIQTYNPAQYGLYYTRIGEDTKQNDMLENVVVYKERASEAIKGSESTDNRVPTGTDDVSVELSDTGATTTENSVFSPYWLLPIVILIIIILSIILINSNKKKR